MFQHPHLTSPIQRRGHRLRDHIVFGANTAQMAELGLPRPRLAENLLERALGGAAMILQQLYLIGAHGVQTCPLRRTGRLLARPPATTAVARPP